MHWFAIDSTEHPATGGDAVWQLADAPNKALLTRSLPLLEMGSPLSAT
jgi:hypothetical protein